MALLTKEEAAAELGVTTKVLDSWRWKGIGPAWVSLPKATRYDIEEIRRYIHSRTRQPSVTSALAATRHNMAMA